MPVFAAAGAAVTHLAELHQSPQRHQLLERSNANTLQRSSGRFAPFLPYSRTSSVQAAGASLALLAYYSGAPVFARPTSLCSRIA